MKPKTLLYILLAIAVVAVGAFLLYQVIYPNNSTTGGTTQTGSLPNTTNQQFPIGTQSSTTTGAFNAGAGSSSSVRFGIVSNEPTSDYFVNNANIVTIIKPDGTIGSIINNITSTITTATFEDIVTTAFSYDGKKVLVSSRTETTTQASVFDLTTKLWTKLPLDIISPVWSPTNYQIAYFTSSNTGTETLTTINMGVMNAKPVVLSTLTMQDSLLQWPVKNTFIISDRPSAFTTGSIWSFSAVNNALSLISFEKLGSESTWDNSGSSLVFSAQHSNQGGSLALTNPAGSQKKLSFITLPSKCVFHQDAVVSAASSTVQTASTTKQASTSTTSTVLNFYCGVPRDQDTLTIARLPDEYDQKILFTADDIYKINASDGASTDLLSGQTIDAINLKVFNNILFFVNRYDQKLYALTL